ncbi:unnamed protein product [Coffea canephora]|uniref:Uncharacterized protein n=1 Tax=Coffea canephora TaxID=49390 RepID=A0A068UC04_COFCA|nr:unnamed protein product [Coffea canephora]
MEELRQLSQAFISISQCFRELIMSRIIYLRGLLIAKPFKFHGFWMSHNDFPQLLHKAWRTEFQGDPMRTFCLKLKEVKTALKELNKKEFWDISAKTIHAQEAL